MQRRRSELVVLAWSLVAAAPALRAEPQGGVSRDGARVRHAAERELGLQLGMEMGGRVTPGGLRLGGGYLYQLSEDDWFDGGFGFTFGGGEAACFRERDDDRVCDHGLLSGFGGEVFGGVRRFFTGKQGLVPYLRGGVALRVVSFRGDEVLGLALPLWLGGGVRKQVHERVAVSAGAELRAGAGHFNSELDLEPQLSLMVHSGVEFTML